MEHEEVTRVRVSQTQPVNVVALDIPFWKLVGFLVKFIIASVPAGILATIVIYVLYLFFGLLLMMFSI